MTQVEDMQRQAAESGQTFDIDQAEQYAMDTVLGQRRDWYVGIGPSIPRSSYLLAQAQYDSSSSGSSSRRVPDPVVSELQAALAAQQAAMEEMRHEQRAQMEAFQRQFFAYTQQHPSTMQTSPAMLHPGTTPPSASMPNVQTPSSASMPNAQTLPPASMPNAQTPDSVEFQRHRSSGSAQGRQGARGRSGGRGGRAFKNRKTSSEKRKQKEQIVIFLIY